MLELIPLEADNVVGFRIEGKIAADEFDEVVAVIEERLERHDKLRIYAEVPSFGGMSARAFIKDMNFGLRNWRHFEKEAVVTEKAWLRRMAQLGGRLAPGIEIRVFSADEKDEARAWVHA